MEVGQGDEPVVLGGGVEDGEAFEIANLGEMFVERLIEGVGFALGFDAEGGVPEVDHFEGVKERKFPAEGFFEGGGGGVGLGVGAGGAVEGGDDVIHVGFAYSGGENDGGMALERRFGDRFSGGGEEGSEVGGGAEGV